jgi:nucleoside-diphosphate-sugar epimerase
MPENGPLRPHTPYARDKLRGEELAMTSGLPSVVFRLFNVYGPGDIPGRYRNAIPNMMRALDDTEGRIRIFGETASRDFTYVGDVVRYFLDAERAKGEAVNIGTGSETLVTDLAHKILDLFGLDTDRLVFEPARSWDLVSRRVADIARLTQLYGPTEMRDLDEGLPLAAEWLHRTGRIKRSPR